MNQNCSMTYPGNNGVPSLIEGLVPAGLNTASSSDGCVTPPQVSTVDFPVSIRPRCQY